MSDLPPADEDEEWIQDEAGWDDDDEANKASESNPVKIGRVALDLSGHIFADVYITIPKLLIEQVDIDVHPLYRALGLRKETPEEKFIRQHGLTDDENYSPSGNIRGPYYGMNALCYKLKGMRNIWRYILRIVRVPAPEDVETLEGDDNDLYYIELEPERPRPTRHAKSRRRPAQ